jgi:radical SAM superfamily enzyme with C-terminal helix-hairpin-helix motif
MKRTLIRYKTKPDAAGQNAGLIAKVFEELKVKAPAGVRYLSLRLDDDTFIHFVEAEEGSTPLPSLEAFKAFQSGIRERCVEPPVPSGVTILGNYRMLSEH